MVFSLYSLLACVDPSGKPETGEDSGAPDSGEVDTAPPDTDTAAPTGARRCASGAWPAAVVDEAAALFVDTEGDDAGAGTAASPVRTLAQAVALATTSGLRVVSVGPGEHPTRAEIADAALVGLSITGCSTDETTLVDVDAAAPDRLLFVRDVEDVTFTSLALRGGERSVYVQDGAGVTLEDVVVTSPSRTGLFVYGEADVTLVDVWIDSPIPVASAGYEIGYGISVQGENDARRASLTMEGGGIRSAQVAGLIAQAAEVTLVDVTIDGTGPDALTGYFGRGVQVQGYSSLVVDGGVFESNSDAAIFSIGSVDVEVGGGAQILSTAASSLPTGGEVSGDGVVVIRGDDAADFYTYTALVDDCVIDGNARAGVVVEDVTYTLGTITGTNGGVPGYEGYELFVQGSAVDSGSSSATVTTPETALQLNLETFALE